MNKDSDQMDRIWVDTSGFYDEVKYEKPDEDNIHMFTEYVREDDVHKEIKEEQTLTDYVALNAFDNAIDKYGHFENADGVRYQLFSAGTVRVIRRRLGAKNGDV